MSDTFYGRIPAGRPASKERLVELYDPVVNYLVGRFKHLVGLAGRDIDDIRQDAYLGLLAAYRDYDPERGMAFKSYVVSMIKWHIQNGVREADNNLKNAYLRDKDIYNALANMDSLDRMAEELGDKMVLAVEKPNFSEFDFRQLASLAGDGRTALILERYYLHDETMTKIGRRLGLCRERVRQIIEAGLRAIRRRLENGGHVDKARRRKKKLKLVEPLRTGRVPLSPTAPSSVIAQAVGLSYKTVAALVARMGRSAVVDQVNEILQQHRDDALLRPMDLAGELGVSANTIYGWVRSGKVASVKIFGSVCIPSSQTPALQRLAEAAHGPSRLAAVG